MITISITKVDNILILIGVDWKKYEKDFSLRTDAVWEK